MEILEHGKYFKDDVCTCIDCSCVFRYEPDDLVKLQHIGEDVRTLVICPECKERNYLD